MDVPPPFTPLFDDPPMAMGYEVDMALDDSLDAAWAPGTREGRPPRFESAPNDPDEANFFWYGSLHMGRFADGEQAALEREYGTFDLGSLPTYADSNGTIVHSSAQMCSIDSDSNLPGISSTEISGTSEANTGSHSTSVLLTDLEFLKSLPHHLLQEISKNASEALLLSNQATKDSLEPPQDSRLGQLRGANNSPNAAGGSKAVAEVLRCEHPGCKTTFRRNKDRLRHFRQKHSMTAESLACPVVHFLGRRGPSGHKFHRTDKLRDHLRSAETLLLSHWACVIPGCSYIANQGRESLIDHLRQHDYHTRKTNSRLLKDYGFGPRSYWDYFWAEYICNIPGCPFGTHEKDAMQEHLATPHDGPFCPCPIKDCEVVSQDWDSASTHLGAAHDHATRQLFQRQINSQRLYPAVTLVCPVCRHETKKATEWNFREHYQTHSRQKLLLASESLLKDWIFAFGKDVQVSFEHWKVTLTGTELLAYLILPSNETDNFRIKADFEQAGAQLKVALEAMKSEGAV